MRHRRDYLPVAVAAFLIALLSGVGAIWLHDYMEPRAERDATRYSAVQVDHERNRRYEAVHALRATERQLNDCRMDRAVMAVGGDVEMDAKAWALAGVTMVLLIGWGVYEERRGDDRLAEIQAARGDRIRREPSDR